MAENIAESPWEPCSVAAGFDPFDSVVTVIGVEARTRSCSSTTPTIPTPRCVSCASLAKAIANPGSNNAFMRTGSVAVAINPDHAAVLARAGLGRADVQRELHRLATNRRGDLRQLNPAFVGAGDADDELHALPSPDHVLVLVAGGGGLYSTVFPSWSAGAHLNPILHERIETDQACAARRRPADGQRGDRFTGSAHAARVADRRP